LTAFPFVRTSSPLRVLFVIFSTNPPFTVYGGGTKRGSEKDVDASLPNFSEKEKAYRRCFLKGPGKERTRDEGAGLLVLCVTTRSTALPSVREGEESGICMIDTLFKLRLV
jgi:hypothetical protein